MYELAKLDKSEIQNLIKKIIESSKEEKLSYDQEDIKFYTFIAKHILFFKHIKNTFTEQRELSVLISDLYNLIVSDLKKEIRYSHLIERSIIENYLRLSIKEEKFISHIDYTAFETIKTPEFCLCKGEYNLIYDAYKNSSKFIHGAENLDGYLADIFLDCMYPKEITTKRKKNKNINRRFKLVNSLDKLFIIQNASFVDLAFHRNKSALSYLLNETLVDLYYQTIDE